MNQVIEIEIAPGHKERVRETNFQTMQEEWNSYLLPDGSKVKVKAIVTRIFFPVDADGHPIIEAEGTHKVYVRQNLQVVTQP